MPFLGYNSIMAANKQLFPTDFLSHFGSTIPEASEKIERYQQDLGQHLHQLSPDVLSSPCPEQAWTPLHILEHIHYVQQGFLKALEHLHENKEALTFPQGQLSETGNPISPEMAEPQGYVNYDNYRTWLEKLAATNSAIISIAAQLNSEELSRTCLHHGFLGDLTALQVVQNAAWHLQHHSKQLPQAG